MKLAIVAGGTGGHIYPGIAVAEVASGDQVLFIGSNEGLEKELVEKAGFSIKLIRARALLRKLSYKAISAPFVSAIGFFQALQILRNFKPDALFSTGGYVSMPVVLAAACLRIPVVLHEQNVLPGVVNRFCRLFAEQVFLSFDESRQYLGGEVVGNPVRQAIKTADRSAARHKYHLQPTDKMVLVMGGSQGSRKMNTAILEVVTKLPTDVQLFHLMGKRDYRDMACANYHPIAYEYQMADLLAAADVVVSRAGATAIAEFLVRGLPMILVPFPYSAEDHQRLNAAALVKRGVAWAIADADFTGEKFLFLLTELKDKYGTMKEQTEKYTQNDAAQKIIGAIHAGI